METMDSAHATSPTGCRYQRHRSHPTSRPASSPAAAVPSATSTQRQRTARSSLRCACCAAWTADCACTNRSLKDCSNRLESSKDCLKSIKVVCDDASCCCSSSVFLRKLVKVSLSAATSCRYFCKVVSGCGESVLGVLKGSVSAGDSRIPDEQIGR